MKQLPTYKRVMLRDLFQASKPTDPYKFHETYRLSPAQIYSFTNEYSAENIVGFSGKLIFLTKKGRAFVWENRFELLGTWPEKSWRRVKDAEPWQSTVVHVHRLHVRWLDSWISELGPEQFREKIWRDSGAGG